MNPRLLVLFLSLNGLALLSRSQVLFDYRDKEFREEHQHTVEVVKVSFPVFSGADKGVAAINRWISMRINDFIRDSGVDTTHQIYPSWSAVQIPSQSSLDIDLAWNNERLIELKMTHRWDDDTYFPGTSTEVSCLIVDLTSGQVFEDDDWLTEDQRKMISPDMDELLKKELGRQDSLSGQPGMQYISGGWSYEIRPDVFTGHFHYFHDREHLRSETVELPMDQVKKYIRPEILWLIGD